MNSRALRIARVTICPGAQERRAFEAVMARTSAERRSGNEGIVALTPRRRAANLDRETKSHLFTSTAARAGDHERPVTARIIKWASRRRSKPIY